MPRAGAVSHRQQNIRIANNIEEFSPLVRSPATMLADWYSVSVFRREPLGRRPARHRQHLAGNLRAPGAGGIDLANGPVACVD